MASVERHEKLSKELEVFRAIFNKRVKYFSALQEISDSVCDSDCSACFELIQGDCARVQKPGR
jgi:hypothetical protein